MKKFLKSLIDNNDSSVNSKLFGSLIGIVLFVGVVITDIIIDKDLVNIYTPLLAFTLGLAGVSQIPTRKEKERFENDNER